MYYACSYYMLYYDLFYIQGFVTYHGSMECEINYNYNYIIICGLEFFN